MNTLIINTYLFLIGFGFFNNLIKPENRNIQIQGIYCNENDNNIKFYFDEEKFLLLNENSYTHLSLYHCSDTLALGLWEEDKKYPFIKLYTDITQSFALVDYDIEEISSSNDSITLYIKNPIEDFSMQRDVYYSIKLETGDYKFDKEVSRMYFYSNIIKLPLPSTKTIKTITVTVFPKELNIGWRWELRPRYFSTSTYKVKDFSTKQFNLNMPTLTYCYMSSYIFKGEYVKIINNRKIEWQGEIYTKK